jgi:hypothetical protein
LRSSKEIVGVGYVSVRETSAEIMIEEMEPEPEEIHDR